MRIEVKLSKTGLLDTGRPLPLVAKATGAARVMAGALFDDAHTDGKRHKLTFSTKGRANLSDDYMRKLGPRFANREFWREWAQRQPRTTGKGASLFVFDAGWSWKNSNQWHRLARKDDASFDRTGGMWEGLRVRNFGTTAAIIEFAGRSEGQTGEWKKKRGRVKEGETRAEVRSGKVNNSLKAWTVYAETGVLVVAPSKAAQDAFEEAVGLTAASWTVAVVGGSVTPKDTATSGLAREFQNAMRTG